MGINRLKIGILGGGQLAKMLAEAAHPMGLSPIVFTSQLSDQRALKEFFHSVSINNQPAIVIFENEFIDCNLLRRMARGKIRFVPTLSTMQVLQNKLSQKKLLGQLQIPTSNFVEFKKAKFRNIEDWLQEMTLSFGKRFVLKWAMHGYDGKGTFFVSESNLKAATKFCQHAMELGVSIYAETQVAFTRELSLVSVFSRDEGFISYPLVVSEQKLGVCFRVLGPADALGVPRTLQSKARSYARKLAKSISLYGTFAIEFFETVEGKLLVNEIAPRVHNTGHITLNSCNVSQFENHLHAVLGQPLIKPNSCKAFVMVNLLGDQDQKRRTKQLQRIDKFLNSTPPHGISLYWYDKNENRPGRKMGHINGVAFTNSEKRTFLTRTIHFWKKVWERGA